MNTLPPRVSHAQEIHLPFLEKKQILLAVKREDLLHRHISGNKYRKLYYNLLSARRKSYKTLLTFGGAYSNHIAATAYAAKLFGFRSIGIIRGEELARDIHHTLSQNPSLRFAAEQGMELHFISRKAYREKENPAFIKKLEQQFGEFYLIPQGGTNRLGVKGAMEILTENDYVYDYVACAVGTGGTIAGLIESSADHQTVLGFPALKEQFLEKEIAKFTDKTRWKLIRDYHFGGFARANPSLIHFINDFHRETGLLLDPVYTGKMMFGLMDLIAKDFFPPGSKILAIHTGGLQGIDGMNALLRKKGWPLIAQNFYE